MNDKRSENFIKQLFFDKYKILCKKIDENKGKNGETPDFLLYKNNLKFAVCEIKEITDNINDGTWEEINDDDIKSYEKISAPAITKIAGKIKKACGQMKQYNLPKVMVFVDYFLDFVTSLQFVIPGHSFAQDIDLYIWIDKGSVNKEDKIHFRYFDNNSVGKQLRTEYFIDIKNEILGRELKRRPK